MNIDSPNLGLTYFNFLGEAQCKKNILYNGWDGSLGEVRYRAPYGVNKSHLRWMWQRGGASGWDWVSDVNQIT